MATDCGCHVVSVRVQHGTGVDVLEVAHCPLHKAAGKLLEACKEIVRLWDEEGCMDDAAVDACRAAIKVGLCRVAVKEAEK